MAFRGHPGKVCMLRPLKRKPLHKPVRFELFLPLHHFWLDYMSELLGLSQPPSTPGALPTAKDVPAATGMHAKLVKADFHGSIITGCSSVHMPGFSYSCSIISKAKQEPFSNWAIRDNYTRDRERF
jgi:hypothetical protein